MKRGFLSLGRAACRARFTRRATARGCHLGLWVAVLMASLRAAMEVQS